MGKRRDAEADPSNRVVATPCMFFWPALELRPEVGVEP